MEVIWKFPLKIIPAQRIEMPTGARPLCVQLQRDVPCIWAQVSPERTDITGRWVYILPTGFEFNCEITGDYLGTFQMASGYVYHVFIHP